MTTGITEPTIEVQPPENPRQKRTIEEYIGGTLMLTMVGILFIQVIARFVFQNSLS